jgi:outer membrane protein W
MNIKLLRKLAGVGLLVFFAIKPAFSDDFSQPIKKPKQKEVVVDSPQTERVRFGLKGGVNFSNYFTEPKRNFDTRHGLVGGIALEVPVSGRFFFQPELGYTQHRSKYAGNDAAPFDAQVDHVEIQILGKFRFADSQESVKPFFIAGGSAGYLLRSKFIVAPLEVDAKDSTANWLFNLVGGLGTQISMAEGIDLGLEARYMFGMSNFYKNSTDVAKNRTIYIGATLFF